MIAIFNFDSNMQFYVNKLLLVINVNYITFTKIM